MIEVNLVPGASKKSRRGRSAPKGAAAGPKLRLPSMQGLAPRLPQFDRFVAGAVAAWIVGGGAIGWLWIGDRRHATELNEKIEVAADDSARYAKLIEAAAKLQARRDTIAFKLQMIQDIDARRFVWPHLLDEISRALPDYTWLTKVSQAQNAETDDGIDFEIKGQTGNNFALTRFMSDLERSPYIRNVKLTTMDLSRVNENDQQLVYDFILQASYETPTADLVQTVPIFAAQE